MHGGLVGRDEELRLLGRHVGLLDAARRGPAVVSGQAGVGKSSLLRVLASRVDTAGWAVLRATATASAAGIPFGAVARLLLDLGVTERPAAPSWILLRDAVAGLRARAESTPVLVAVDDAHLLDDGSAALLEQVVEDGSASVVLTVRSGERRPDAVREVQMRSDALHLELQELGPDDVPAFLAALVDGETSRETERAFYQASGGNPLLLHDLVLDALDAGTLTRAGGLWTWTGGTGRARRLSQAVADRIDGLDARARHVLGLVAVGEPIGAAGLEGVERDASLDALERRGLIRYERAGGGGPTLVMLGHPLYGDAFRADIPAGELRQLSATAAALIRTEGGPLDRSARLRLVRLELDGGVQVDRDELLAAAHDAVILQDAPLAARLARAAANAGVGPSASLVLGASLLSLGLLDEAEVVLAPLVDELVDDRSRVQLAAVQQQLFAWGRGDDDAAAAALDRIEARVQDPIWRQVLEGCRLQRLMVLGHLEEVERRGAPLIAPEADPRVRIKALGALAPGRFAAGRFDEMLELCDELLPVAFAVQADLPQAVAWVISVRTGVLIHAGRAAEVQHIIPLVRSQAAIGDQEAAVANVFEGRVALLSGDVPTARRALREARATLVRHDGFNNLRWATALLAEAEALGGDPQAGLALVTELPPLDACNRTAIDLVGDVDRSVAWVKAASGRRSEAVDDLRALGDRLEASGLHASAVIAHFDAVRLGDRRHSAERVVALGSRLGGFGAQLARGVAALVDGDAPTLLGVGDELERGGTVLLAAETSAWAALWLRAQGRASSAAAAERIAADRADRCGRPRTPALDDLAAPPVLTRREREVAGLAATGLSNQAIADQLVVSVRTVEGHLHQAYTKLGVTSRGALLQVLST